MPTDHLVCAICLYTRKGVVTPAVTIIDGLAVCEDHLGYVRHDAINYAIRDAKEKADAD